MALAKQIVAGGGMQQDSFGNLASLASPPRDFGAAAHASASAQPAHASALPDIEHIALLGFFALLGVVLACEPPEASYLPMFASVGSCLVLPPLLLMQHSSRVGQTLLRDQYVCGRQLHFGRAKV